MVVKCMQLTIILLSASFLGAVLLSFGFVKFPKLDQVQGRLTNYLTWHGKINGFDPNQNDAMFLLSIVLMIVTGAIGTKSIINPQNKPKFTTYFFPISDDSDANVTGVPAIGFNRLLIFYNWATAITVFAAMLIDIGKLWSMIGIYHNSAEIVILVLIGSGGRIKNSSFFAWMLLYVMSTCAAFVFIKFPNDAAFFEFQGLCMDFALVIEFIRIYITTKEHIRDAERDTLPLLNADEDDNNDNNNSNKTNKFWPIWPTTIEYPKQLLLLILASSVHLGGNITTVFFPSQFIPLLIFRFSYAVSFPVYNYYVYLDTQAASVLPQKRIYLPYTPKWKVISLTIFSIALSLLTIRLGFVFQ